MTGMCWTATSEEPCGQLPKYNPSSARAKWRRSLVSKEPMTGHDPSGSSPPGCSAVQRWGQPPPFSHGPANNVALLALVVTTAHMQVLDGLVSQAPVLLKPPEQQLL